MCESVFTTKSQIKGLLR